MSKKSSFMGQLGKSFVRSAVNQVGRDAGKVMSNQLYGDAHSTPHRLVGGTSSYAQSYQYNQTQIPFDTSGMTNDQIVEGLLKLGWNYNLPQPPGAFKLIIIYLLTLSIPFAGIICYIYLRGRKTSIENAQLMEMTTKTMSYVKVSDRRFRSGYRMEEGGMVTEKLYVPVDELYERNAEWAAENYGKHAKITLIIGVVYSAIYVFMMMFASHL